MPPKKFSYKTIIGPLLALLVLAGLIVYGLKSSKAPAAATPQNQNAPAAEWPSTQMRRETVTDDSKGYSITAYYPVTRSDAITAIFRSFVEEQIESSETNTAEAGELPEGFRDMTLDIAYEEQKVARADNYIFTIYSDTGGAHGLQASKTFSFTKEGRRIMLADLFTVSVQGGLGVVAENVKAQLLKKEFADKNLIAEGAAPLQENYANFIVEDGGVTFIFDPYQVAAYAAGTQKVTVPASAFRTIANPELFR